MKQLALLIFVVVLGIPDFTNAQDRNFTDERDGTQRIRTYRVTDEYRDDSIVHDLITEYKTTRDEFIAEIRSLRQQIEEATADNRADLKEQLVNLLRSNRKAQRDFRKDLRRRVRELRVVGN